jgi:hypothetical protein
MKFIGAHPLSRQKCQPVPRRGKEESLRYRSSFEQAVCYMLDLCFNIKVKKQKRESITAPSLHFYDLKLRLEFFLRGYVEEAADRIGIIKVVAVSTILVDRQRRMRVEDVLNTEGKRSVREESTPSPA